MVIMMTTVKQEKQRINQLLSRDAKTDKDIDEIYNEAVDRLRIVVNQAFDKYSVDGVLVPANLHKKVTRSDMLLLKRQYEKLPDELELPEIERRDNYLAVSQTSQRGLITATLGMALIGVTHKVVSAIKKNNRTAVDDEVQYIQQNNDLSKTQKKRIRTKARKIEQPDYEFKSSNDLNVPWLDRIWLDHDKILNRIDSTINDQLKKGMHAEDIADKLFPENAESMRQDNIPKSVRDASISAKRLARTEAATREDELTERSFKSQKVKYYDWVTEPGACKKCLAIAIAGPYKFGDLDSPRPPGDSHPNCRCRRIPVDAPTSFDFVDLSKNDTQTIKKVSQRLDMVIEEYKTITGVDIRREIANDTFISKKHPYSDPKAKFMTYLYHKVGYDELPKEVNTFQNSKIFNFPGGSTNALYRGIHDSDSVKATDLLNSIKYGKMPISGAMNSTKGRGIYLTTVEFMAKSHLNRGKNGILTKWGIDKDANIADFEQLTKIISENKELVFLKRPLTFETNTEIIAVLSGYDIIEAKAVQNVLNRGKLQWKK